MEVSQIVADADKLCSVSYSAPSTPVGVAALLQFLMLGGLQHPYRRAICSWTVPCPIAKRRPTRAAVISVNDIQNLDLLKCKHSVHTDIILALLAGSAIGILTTFRASMERLLPGLQCHELLISLRIKVLDDG